MLARSSPSLFPLLLLGLLAGMTYWLELTSRDSGSGRDGRLRHDPDYLVEDFVIRRYGPDGNLQHTLHAALMKHFPDDDSTVVSKPSLIYHRQPPTHVSAREALIDGKGEHIQLREEVRVTRAGLAGKADTVLLTSRLDAYPEEEFARNDEPVTITQGLSQVTGSGMQANNKTGVYVLEGPVHGIFHRNQANSTTTISPPRPERPAAKARPASRTKPKANAKPVAKQKPRP